MIATVVRAAGAPGPTLVVESSGLPPEALASREELSALRAALARTGHDRLAKIALYGPSRTPGRDLDYRFVQALPDGGFDFRTGCGHSLLACVAAAGARSEVSVRAVTTGDHVLCTPEQPQQPQQSQQPQAPGQPEEPAGASGPGTDRSYTLHFLGPPDAPGVLPTGRAVDLLDGVPASLVRYGNPYVFVDAHHLGLHGRDELFAAGAPALGRLLALRAHAARALGHPPHSALPKIAAVVRSTTGTAVRALTVDGWHPSLALTGATALAAASVLPGTVVGPLTGAVDTPGGPVTVCASPDRISVRHKRATVLGRLELPWRVHATA
ncbi:PrpF domain-containing protein [Streptomyces sp. NPDC051567]|uniref:PrpF domain-containing protein n=1 Tax=Streptomyces sp. NPDC051567 TaxID=3365660 RepID=UPI0037AD97AD